MLKNLIVLPDGTELFSGTGQTNNIRSTVLTECVNSGEELTLGSVCSNMVEVTVQTPRGGLSLTAGDEVTLYKVDDAGARHKVGLFTLEKPTRPSANLMKLTGYDRVAKLDKDLTSWLKGLTGWPYDLLAFAGMVCKACGLTFVASDRLPNADFPIQQWMKTGATGRQIMRWLGEIVCRYVFADPDGNIRFGWYTNSDRTYTPNGKTHYFAGKLSYENYQVAPIETVQIRLADSDSGALWPQVEEGANSYIITGNPILTAYVTEDLLPYLKTIATELSGVTYTPCEISAPADPSVKAGDIVNITDRNGKQIVAYVMSKKTSGQRDTLTCTGSPRRDSPSAAYNKTEAEKKAETEMDAWGSLKWKDLFNKLTRNGEVQGFFEEDGQVVVNARYIMSGSFTATAQAHLPPTYDDVLKMLWSLTFPDRFPPENFYDLNGDGSFTNDDLWLAYDVYLGKTKISDCPGAYETEVTITIDPSNAETPILIVGTNMWGSKITAYLGPLGSRIPVIEGDCSVGGRFAVGGHAIISALALTVEETPKNISWKSNGDGTFTLIGT